MNVRKLKVIITLLLLLITTGYAKTGKKNNEKDRRFLRKILRELKDNEKILILTKQDVTWLQKLIKDLEEYLDEHY